MNTKTYTVVDAEVKSGSKEDIIRKAEPDVTIEKVTKVMRYFKT